VGKGQWVPSITYTRNDYIYTRTLESFQNNFEFIRE